MEASVIWGIIAVLWLASLLLLSWGLTYNRPTDHKDDKFTIRIIWIATFFWIPVIALGMPIRLWLWATIMGIPLSYWAIVVRGLPDTQRAAGVSSFLLVCALLGAFSVQASLGVYNYAALNRVDALQEWQGEDEAYLAEMGMHVEASSSCVKQWDNLAPTTLSEVDVCPLHRRVTLLKVDNDTSEAHATIARKERVLTLHTEQRSVAGCVLRAHQSVSYCFSVFGQMMSEAH